MVHHRFRLLPTGLGSRLPAGDGEFRDSIATGAQRMQVGDVMTGRWSVETTSAKSVVSQSADVSCGHG